MDANAEPQPILIGCVIVDRRQLILDSNSTMHRIDDAGKLGQHAISCGFRDPTAVFRNEPIHDLTVSGESPERSGLISAHQARIACHVRREDRGQPPFQALVLRRHAFPPAMVMVIVIRLIEGGVEGFTRQGGPDGMGWIGSFDRMARC